VPNEEQRDVVIDHSPDGTPDFGRPRLSLRGRIGVVGREIELSVIDTAASDEIAAAHDAFERHEWQEALDHFTRADKQAELSGPDLQRMAEAAWFTGQAELMIEAFERAFKEYSASGQRAGAARVAVDLATQYAFKGQGSIAGAWLRRSERLLANEPEGAAHGHLALSRAQIARDQGRVDKAVEQAEEAVRIGSESGDMDLEAQALVALGTMKIAAGAVVEGFQMLEEASVAAVNGELSPLVTGITYCQMISVCRDLTDYVRAGEWTEATEKWCEKQSISGFPGICRVHRAEVVAMSGAWDQAEAELERATAELEAYNATPPRADGLYSLAVLRFRRGNIEGAEEALRQSHALGHSTQPLLALIRLAQGNVRTAAAGIRSALQEQTWDQWTRARMLPAQVEIATAAGEGAIAREAAEELDGLVVTFDTVAMQGERELAWGRVLLAEGDYAEAAARLRVAIGLWRRIGAPYETARSRQLLARALRAIHDDDQADLELDAAFKDLDTLGAKRDADAVAAEIAAVSARRSGPTQTRRTFVFTDIVGSTNLAELLGDEAWDQLLRWHDDTLRELFVAHGGEVVNSTGDGFFVAFETSASAVDAAIAVQRRLAEHRRSTGFAPMVRIGLHAAEASHHGTDYSGVGVHTAARVAALAQGGEIQVTFDALEGVSGVSTSAPREAALKGIDAPVQVVAVDWE
jgi:class 3 adenylate cyclase